MAREDLPAIDTLAGRDVPVARLLGLGLGIGVTVLAAVAVVFALLHRWQLAPGGETGAAARLEAMPLPRLQTAPQAASGGGR